MTLMLLVLLAAFALGTGLVLADSGLRLWSALGLLKARARELDRRGALPVIMPSGRPRPAPRITAPAFPPWPAALRAAA